MPQALGTRLEDVACIDRQHRRRSAEQHGEKVERNRPEDDAVLPYVAQAVDHLLPRVASAIDSSLRLRADEEDAHESEGKQPT